MNYGGNMPDWHQFNASQTNEVTPAAQNVNSGHMAFIPGVNSSSLNAINLSSEGLDKHQNDPNFNPRHFQSINNISNGPNISNNVPHTSMVQMQNCMGHYGTPNTRNPMLDNLNGTLDPRNASIGTINDDLGYRSNQVPFNGPIGHLGGPNCNVSAPSGANVGARPVPGHGTASGSVSASGLGSGQGTRHRPIPVPGSGNVGPRNASITAVPPSRVGPSSFIPCKGLCCNPDPNINYQQWEKFGSYQANTSYRDNVPTSGYQTENRHFGNSCNYRKESYDGKESLGPMLPSTSNVDHRRNFTDYKYHKDHLVSRNYPAPSGMLHNYPVQNYNYTGEYQKYTYPVKEQPKTNSMNVSNPGVIKHQEQNFIAQQKYNNKQFQYQNGNLLPKTASTLNVNPNMVSSPQNTYFNPQFARNVPTEVSRECQETTDTTTGVNRVQSTYVHGSHSRYQMYQQKIAMQKYSMENHLRELSRIPGYQTHPKYKECILRYREILKLQQTTGYPNQVQQTSRIPTSTNSAVPPINLQFDQNGMLINSTYIPESFPKVQHVSNAEQRPENLQKQNKNQGMMMPEPKQGEIQQSEHLLSLSQNEHASSACAESFQKQSELPIQKDFNQNQLKVQTRESHTFDGINSSTDNQTIMQQKVSKEFANKPDLDVRQFLANWDETDDEEETVSNLPDAVLSNTTPVVVVSYENVDLSTKTSQNTEVSRETSFCTDKTTFDSEKKDENNVITTQDCLTISYSSSGNTEIAKPPGKTIREGVVKPGSIIHCISNGPDEIPTIHIVDNLEISSILGAPSDQAIETLESQKTISFFKERTNADNGNGASERTEQHKTNNAVGLTETPVENSNIAEIIQTPAISIGNQELQVLSISTKNSLDSAENPNLKKQNSFTCEESHNPDDISLPDLPTSECTPISTTLNTPIHSDSEESSESIEDLTISTNPIEIMQNSPVISFTQSPVKMEPYRQLDDEQSIKRKTIAIMNSDFQKDNLYNRNSTTNPDRQEVVPPNNFDFSTNSSSTESTELAKSKQIKSLGNNCGKKAFGVDSNEYDTSVSDTCSALSAMRYELEIMPRKIQDKSIDSERHLATKSLHENESPNATRETNQENAKNSHSIRSVMQNNNSLPAVNPSESESELHNNATSEPNLRQVYENQKESCRAQKETSSDISTIACTSPDIDPSPGKITKRNAIWEDQIAEEQLERNSDKDRLIKLQKRNSEHPNCFQKYDTKGSVKDVTNSFRTAGQFACHTTSHNKKCSVAVINDNVALNSIETQGDADKNVSIQESKHTRNRYYENSSEFSSQDPSDRTDIRKNTSNKIASLIHENVHCENSKKSEPLQNDDKTIDGDVVKYTKEEIRMLKNYRRRKHKSHRPRDEQSEKHEVQRKLNHHTDRKDNPHKTCDENVASQKTNVEPAHHRNNKAEWSQLRQDNESLAVKKGCLEQTVSCVVNSCSDILEASEEEKRHTFTKNFIKNTNSEFGIQVANVNLKIKDSEIRKELILGEKTQEHIKDSLDGIKIEINVSCTERNARGLEHSKMLLCESFRNVDDRGNRHVNDAVSDSIEASLSNTSDRQCQLYTKELDAVDNSMTFDKNHKMSGHFLTNEISPNAAIQTKSIVVTTTENNDITTTNKNNEKGLSETSRDTSTTIAANELCNSPSETQPISKPNSIDMSLKDVSGNYRPHASCIQSKVIAVEHKVRSAISNAIATDDNSKPVVREKRIFQDERQESVAVNSEMIPITKTQMQITELTDTLDDLSRLQSTSQSFNIRSNHERELSAVSSHLLKNLRKSSSDSFIRLNGKPLNTLSTLDLNFETLDYKKCSGINFDRSHIPADESIEYNRIGKWKRPQANHLFEDCNAFESTSGYINPIFSSIDNPEDLHTVPVYTTKDGRISYSPNRRFTYHELMMEARKQETPSSAKKSYSDALSKYLTSSKFRKLYKKKHHHTNNDRKKQSEFKNMKCLYSRRKSYVIDPCGRDSFKYREHGYDIKHHNSYLDNFNIELDRDDNAKEIIDRGMKDIADTNNHTEKHGNNAPKCTVIVESDKGDSAVVHELDSRKKNEEAAAPVVNSFCETKNPCSEVTESIQSPFSHSTTKCSKSCENVMNNINSVPVMQKSIDTPCSSSSEHGIVNKNSIPHMDAGVDAQESTMECKSCDLNTGNSNLNENVNCGDKQSCAFSTTEKTEDRNVCSYADKITSSEITPLDSNLTVKMPLMDEGREITETLYSKAIEDVWNEKCSPSEEMKSAQLNSIKETETIVVQTLENHDHSFQTGDHPKTFYNHDHLLETDNHPKIFDNHDHSFETDDHPEIFDNHDHPSKTKDHSANTENLDCKEISKNLKLNQVVERTSHTIEQNSYPTNESEKLKVSNNVIDEIPEVLPELERQISSENRANSTRFHSSVDCKESNAKCEISKSDAREENVESCQHVRDQMEEQSNMQEIASEEQHASKNVEENVNNINSLSSKNENNNCTGADTATVNNNDFLIGKKESQNQELQKDETIDQEIDLQSMSDKINGGGEDINNVEPIETTEIEKHTEELTCLAFPKEFNDTGNDAVAKSVAPDNNEMIEMDIILSPSMEEIATNHLVPHDFLGEHSNDGQFDKMQSVSGGETSPSRDSSTDRDMPVLNVYCSIKNKSDDDTEHEEKITDVHEQTNQENYLSSLESYKTASYSSDRYPDMKAIPKLVIKKSENVNSKTSCSSNYADTSDPGNRYDAKFVSSMHPKIPKMIITKTNSRSVTPSVETAEKPSFEAAQSPIFVHDETSMAVDNSDSDSHIFKFDNYESRVPKVKIKLEDVSSKDLKFCLKRKSNKKVVPKVKIKRIEQSKTEEDEILASATKLKIPDDDSDLSDTTTDSEDGGLRRSLSSDTENSDKPLQFKLRKQEENKPSSSERRRRKDTSIVRIPLKKIRRSGMEGTRHSSRRDNLTSAKVPKVIIKRSQAGAEFKCEISKSGTTSIVENAKWQPKVKLQRLHVLDHMVKDLKQSKITLSQTSLLDAIFGSNITKYTKNSSNDQHQLRDSQSKLSRSNSTSDLSPIKYRQRRPSDYDCIKMDSKQSGINLRLPSCLTSINQNGKEQLNATENVQTKCQNLKRKSKKRSVRSIHDDSDNEIKNTEKYVKDPSNCRLINVKNDRIAVKKEYISSEEDENESIVDDKLLKSDMITHSHSFDDNDNFVIKVESSDESQTTIEILPASPDVSQGELEDRTYEGNKTNELHMEDAMPTQLELELELMDQNNMPHSDVMMPKLRSYDHTSQSGDHYLDEEATESYFREFQHSPRNTFKQNKHIYTPNKQDNCNSDKLTDEKTSGSNLVNGKKVRVEKKIKLPNEYFYCNDSLVKEVLAAKETLKKCLGRSEESNKPRPKTAAEKKQGLGFNFKDITKSNAKSENGHRSNEDNTKVRKKLKHTDKKECETVHKAKTDKTEERYHKQGKRSTTTKKVQSKNLQEESSSSVNRSTASTCKYVSVKESTTISLKASKLSERNTPNEAAIDGTSNRTNEVSSKDKDISKNTHSSDAEDQKDGTNDNGSEVKIKEDNMPLLVPETALNFDPSSDRDSSRSPPVITNQDDVTNVVGDSKDTENKIIPDANKIEDDKKHSYKDCEMSIDDIITQLVYHKKATIKHRRYCNLCERWFPTTSRHRRHLAGYQHRYMELSQRKSIHALFVLFTGRPCPRLLPANVARNDCSIGELTPLQIAVQDVAKCVEHTQEDHKTKE